MDIPGVQDVTTDLQLSNPQVHIEIDRDKASTLGISAQQVELALSCAYGTRQISTIYVPTNQYYVTPGAAPASAPPGSPAAALPALQQGAAGAAGVAGPGRADHRPAAGEPHRPASGRDHLVPT